MSKFLGRAEIFNHQPPTPLPAPCGPPQFCSRASGGIVLCVGHRTGVALPLRLPWSTMDVGELPDAAPCHRGLPRHAPPRASNSRGGGRGPDPDGVADPVLGAVLHRHWDPVLHEVSGAMDPVFLFRGHFFL